MQVIDLKVLRKSVDEIKSMVDYLEILLADDNVLIADIPAPAEKKVRKKRVTKNKTDLPNPEPEVKKPRRGRRGRNQSTESYPNPPLRPGETP